MPVFGIPLQEVSHSDTCSRVFFWYKKRTNLFTMLIWKLGIIRASRLPATSENNRLVTASPSKDKLPSYHWAVMLVPMRNMHDSRLPQFYSVL